MVIIFGHFLLPFLVLLPICVKSNFKIMLWVCVWAWVMNYADLAFNICPCGIRRVIPSNGSGCNWAVLPSWAAC